MDASEVIHRFNIKDPIISIEPFGGGHINDTFLITTGGKGKKYVLQNVNRYVFRDIEGLMNNISLVTEHIRHKLLEANIPDIENKTLRLTKTRDELLYVDDGDKAWRVFNFIEDHVVYDIAPNRDIAYEGARMFGLFLNHLSDLDPSKIVETIPKFHNIKYRLANLEAAIKEDPLKRVCCLDKEIDYVRSRYEIMSVIQNLGEKGLITPRIVHNDTKINNVLFDKQNRGLCVVDLDTIMPGFLHYDYGDGIRTAANTGEEDDEDLSKIEYDLEIIEAFTEGFIDAVHSILNETERKSLAHATLLFPFIMGVRFLTDYIEGDIYYKVNHTYHNYFRARAQLKLAQDGEAKLLEIQRMINKAYFKN